MPVCLCVSLSVYAYAFVRAYSGEKVIFPLNAGTQRINDSESTFQIDKMRSLACSLAWHRFSKSARFVYAFMARCMVCRCVSTVCAFFAHKRSYLPYLTSQHICLPLPLTSYTCLDLPLVDCFTPFIVLCIRLKNGDDSVLCPYLSIVSVCVCAHAAPNDTVLRIVVH